MKLLLDTHAFIWWDENPTRLGPAARAACLDPSNDLLLSAASVWEIQLKLMIGKLALRKPLRQLVDEHIALNGLEVIAIELKHIFRLETLPFHHRDPFDRLLIAQAQVESATLVTHDGAFGQYGVPVIW